MRFFLTGPAHTKAAAAVCAMLIGLCASASAAASETKRISARAEGQIVSQAPCDDAPGEPPLICQSAAVTGQVSHIGRITGVLYERIDASGSYTGTAMFTTPSGDTFATKYKGQVFARDASGSVSFVEWHTLVDGTGRFGDSEGTLFLTGTASSTGAIAIDGTGTLIR